jgi:hypothetical protein
MLRDSLNSIADFELCLLASMSGEGECSVKPAAGMVETAMLRWESASGREVGGVCGSARKLEYRRGQRRQSC